MKALLLAYAASILWSPTHSSSIEGTIRLSDKQTFVKRLTSLQSSTTNDFNVDEVSTDDLAAFNETIEVQDTMKEGYDVVTTTTKSVKFKEVIHVKIKKVGLGKIPVPYFNFKHINQLINETALLRHLENSKHSQLQQNTVDEQTNVLPDIYTRSDKLILLLASWRTGSSFTGRLLASHPGVFYHYEPLLQYGFKDISKPVYNRYASKTASDLFKCDFNNLPPYFTYASSYSRMVSRYRRFWPMCTNLTKYLCFSSQFLMKVCNTFPIQLMKTVRLRLDKVEFLFKDPDIGTKLYVILLVRDPRGVMNSRKSVKWCQSTACTKASSYCQTYEINFKSALFLKERYPKQFAVLRYEDLARQPLNRTKDLFNFIGFPFINTTQNYLMRHTSVNIEGKWSKFRNSKSRVESWKHKLNFEEIESIQNVCSNMMNHFGYHKYNTSEELEADSVLKFNFPVN